jgi:hypothetical protein
MKPAMICALIGVAGVLGTLGARADAQNARTFTDPNGFHARETAGGYEPADPPVPAGTRASRHLASLASIPASVAYPAPAPDKSYPPCTRQRRDACLQQQ